MSKDTVTEFISNFDEYLRDYDLRNREVIEDERFDVAVKYELETKLGKTELPERDSIEEDYTEGLEFKIGYDKEPGSESISLIFGPDQNNFERNLATVPLRLRLDELDPKLEDYSHREDEERIIEISDRSWIGKLPEILEDEGFQYEEKNSAYIIQGMFGDSDVTDEVHLRPKEVDGEPRVRIDRVREDSKFLKNLYSERVQNRDRFEDLLERIGKSGNNTLPSSLFGVGDLSEEDLENLRRMTRRYLRDYRNRVGQETSELSEDIDRNFSKREKQNMFDAFSLYLESGDEEFREDILNIGSAW